MNEMFFRTRIGKIFGEAWARRQERRLHAQELRQAIEQVVQIADPMICNVDHYQEVLRLPIDVAIQHLTQLIDAIPGPVILNRQGYESDHTVKFLFASPEELDDVVRISPEVQTLRDNGYAGEIKALLTMTRQERTVYGYEQDGEVILRDIAQQAVNFVDHRIVSPAPTMENMKARLVQNGLNILASAAMEIITGLKAQKAELREQKEYLGAMLKIMGGKKMVWESFAPQDSAQLEEMNLAQQRLEEVQTKLAEVQKQLDGPEDAMAFLKMVVERPQEELIIRDYALRLNWKRVRVEGKDDAEGNEIKLVELSNRNGALKRSAVFVTFTLGEVLAN